MPTANEDRARRWAWTSLVVGAFVLAASATAASWPATLVQIGSVVGPALFLFGSARARGAGVVVLVITAVLELITGGVLVVAGLAFVGSPSSLGGFGLLLGVYSLVLVIPVLGVGIVDALAARAMSAALRPVPEGRSGGTTSLPLVNLEVGSG